METLWYAIVAVMLSVYVVLDGFDFGAGMLHLFVARSDQERRQIFNAIGPFWNGNEVWLLASGGLLVFAFPRVYAVGFSGFYLPLMMVLWLLILRGISIEFRSKEDNPLWRTFWDVTFFASSLCMAIVFGAALGNVIRGVPLGAQGYFDGALFTDFQPGLNPGVLDWYTVSVGIFAALVLAGHGAVYLTWKTADAVHDRSLSAARVLWKAILGVGIIVTYLTTIVRPELYAKLISRPWTWSLAALVLASLVSVGLALAKKKELIAFVASSFFIIGLFGRHGSRNVSKHADLDSQFIFQYYCRQRRYWCHRSKNWPRLVDPNGYPGCTLFCQSLSDICREGRCFIGRLWSLN